MAVARTPAEIRTIRQCECSARAHTPHVELVVSTANRPPLSICLGPSQAEATAHSIMEAAKAAGVKFDGKCCRLQGHDGPCDTMQTMEDAWAASATPRCGKDIDWSRRS